MSRTLHIAIAATTLIAAVLIADAWRIARKNSAQLAATLVTQNAMIEQASARETQRNKDLAAALAGIAAAKKHVQTPQQALEAIPSVLPPLPLPIKISIPNLTQLPPNQAQSVQPSLALLPLPSWHQSPLPNAAQSPLPNLPQSLPPSRAQSSLPNLAQPPLPDDQQPATISIPQPDLKPLYDSFQDCRACTLEREATKKNLSDQQSQIAALIRERDAALTAAHGGSFWSHVKQAIKWFAIGAATAALATTASHN